MDKQSVILFSLKKDGNSDKCYNMSELWDMLSEISQSQKDRYYMIPFILGTSIGTEN